MESWKHVFRDGLATLLTTKQLQALRRGLANDDPRLIQGVTVSPPPLQCVMDWPVECGCLIAYPFAFEDGAPGKSDCTVWETAEFFGRMCYEIDQRIGEPAACRHLLNFFDDEPRDEVRRQLLAEVELALAEREATPCST